MQETDFTRDSHGRLVGSVEGCVTFVPAPLPPKIPPGWKLINLLSEADRALGELSWSGDHLPNPHLIIGPFLRREAILSSRLEGTIASAEQLVMYEAMPPKRDVATDAREVANLTSVKHFFP